MEEAPENGKESSHSARANGICPDDFCVRHLFHFFIPFAYQFTHSVVYVIRSVTRY